MEWKAAEKYVFFILTFFTFQVEIQQIIQNSETLLLLSMSKSIQEFLDKILTA